MAHFDYTRPLGVWSAPAVLLNSELADLDAKTEAAINGDGGGTWAPTSQIVIGGSGLLVTTELDVSGLLDVTGNTIIGSTSGDSLTVNATSSFTSGSTFHSFATFEASTVFNAETQFNSTTLFESSVGFASNVNMLSTLGVTGNAVFSNDVSVNHDLTVAHKLIVNGDAIFGDVPDDSVSFNASATLLNYVICDFNGRVLHRAALGPDADATFDPRQVREIYYQSLTLNRVCVIDNTNAIDNEEVFVANDDTSHSVGIRISTDVSAMISVTSQGGNWRAVRLKKIAGTWRIISRERYVTAS